MHHRPTSSLRLVNRITRRHSTSLLTQAIELLEGRRFFDTTPFLVTSGTRSENWEAPDDAKLTNDDWSQIPNFVGYIGSGIAPTTAGDPRTALGDSTVVDVNVNQAPSVTAGGVSEVILPSPIPSTTPNTGLNTVAIQGSGSAVAPNLTAYLDATGASGVRVKFDVIDIDSASGAQDATAAQPFVLQYRVGNSGNWTNVDNTYTPAAAPIGGGNAGTINSFNVVLPAAAANQPLVEVRWITVNVGGNDQLLAIDNIEISAGVDTNPGVFTVAPVATTVVEGTAGTVNITVNRTGGSAGAIDLPYALGGTATAGTDYTAPSGTVHFNAGDTTATIAIPVLNDSVGEPTETITVTLGTPTAGTVGTDKTSTITITDDDGSGTLDFSAAAYTVGEGDGAVTLTVNRTNGSAGAASVPFTIIAGTAQPGSDYVAANGTVSFANGETSKTFTVSIVNDSVTEVDETFSVQLGTPNAGTQLGTVTTATVTIIDNDSVVPTGLVLNEISINPVGTNTPYEFIELHGTPNQILRDVYILIVEGDNTNGAAGQVDGLINLTNATIGSNGLLLVRAPGGFAAEDTASGVFNTTFLNTSLETGSTSFLLFYRPSTSTEPLPLVADDLDTDNVATNNIGGLEGLASSLTPLDAVGILDGGANDIVYGFSTDNGTTPKGAVIPPVSVSLASDAYGYVARLDGSYTPFDNSAFFYANLVTGPNGETTTSKTLDTTKRSANTPADARSTPGGYLTTTVTPTTVVSATLNLGAGPQSIAVVFNQDVGSSLQASDFLLTNLTTGATITLNLASVSADGKTATLTFSGVTGSTAASNVLSSGNYRLRVLGGQVANLAADSDSSLYFQNGDFDHDRDVDFNDLLTLAKNYNGTGKTFAQGDANYDGTVSFSDLLTLAKNYGVTLALPAPAAFLAAAVSTRSRTSFGASVIA